MKKKLLFLGALALSSLSVCAQWVKPVPATTDLQISEQVATEDGTVALDTIVYYMYNKDAGVFFTEGNDWGTQASVGQQGLKVFVSKYMNDEEEGVEPTWDGKTYFIHDYSNAKGAWHRLFIDSETHAYVDLGSQANYYWEIKKVDDAYRLYGGELNPTYNPTEYPESYLGWDISAGTGKTGLTPVLNKAEEETPGTYCVDWQFVLPADYDAFQAKNVVYMAAEQLGTLIEEAKEKGVSTTAAEAVYNNTNSTQEELEAATTQLRVDIAAAIENTVTPDNPKDMTAEYVVNYDFDVDTKGWATTTGAQNSVLATNKVDGTHSTGSFWENWHSSPHSGKMYKVIENVPHGVYSLQMAAFTDYNSDAFVFANSDRVEVTSSNMNTYKVMTIVEVDTLEIGLVKDEKLGQWMGIDNVKLMYYGNSIDSYKYYVENAVTPVTYYEDGDHIYYQTAALDAYKEAIAQATNNDTKETLLAAIPALREADNVMKVNAAAYKAYYEMGQKGLEALLGGFVGEDADLLADYLMYEEPEEGVYNSNGAYEYILEAGELSTEEIAAETAWLSELIDRVLKSIAPGDEVMFLANANFSDGVKGWTSAEGYDSPVGGGLDSNPCAERWNANFDLYQEIVDVPNGVYELKVQAFYRPTGSTTGSYTAYDGTRDAVLTYIYMNDAYAPVCHIAEATYAENLEGNCEEVDAAAGLWVVNGMNSASNAFSQGAYECSLMGVITDGKMKVGIRSTTGSESGRWSLWDNFRLVYKGFDTEAVEAVLKPLVEEAVALTENVMPATELDAIAKVVETAETAIEDGDGEAMFDCITEVRTAIESAKVAIKAYEDLSAASEQLSIEISAYSTTATVEALNAATTLSTEIEEALGTCSYSAEEAIAKIDEIKAAITALKLPAEVASDSNPVDMTSLIVNPSFDNDDNEGWTSTVAAAHQTYQNAEFYDKTFDMYQTIHGIPNGTYEVGVQGYKREVNSSTAWTNYQAGDTSGLTAYLYAVSGGKQAATPLASICSVTVEGGLNGGTEESSVANNVYIPNTMYTASLYFAEGYYKNSIIVEVTDGTLTIGVKQDEKIGADWIMFDNFTLISYGTESSKTPSGDATGIESVETTEVISSTYYTLGGAKVSAPVKGINIVKSVLSNGKVKVQKVFVK